MHLAPAAALSLASSPTAKVAATSVPFAAAAFIVAAPTLSLASAAAAASTARPNASGWRDRPRRWRRPL